MENRYINVAIISVPANIAPINANVLLPSDSQFGFAGLTNPANIGLDLSIQASKAQI